jgi:hypothetical protein
LHALAIGPAWVTFAFGIRNAMKAVAFAVFLAALGSTSCSQRAHSDSEVRSLIIGSWRTSTSFKTTEDDTHIVLKSTGTTAFNADGSMKAESHTLMTITVPEGSVPIDFHAVVHGEWAIVDQALRITRMLEEVTGRDETSERFITSEGMMKLRAESAAQFLYRFKRISSTKIMTYDDDGFRTTYTRDR